MGQASDIFMADHALSTNIGYFALDVDPGAPQRIQTDVFSGVDGGFSLWHGVDPRIVVMRGVAYWPNEVGAYAALILSINNIRNNLINAIGTLRHYVGDTYEDYYYCRMDDYRRIGNVGYNTIELTFPLMARFTQLYW